MTCFLTERWKVKSNSSRVLREGKRAALMRASPPWDSREEISVESTASRKRSRDPGLLAGALNKLRHASSCGRRLQRP